MQCQTTNGARAAGMHLAHPSAQVLFHLMHTWHRLTALPLLIFLVAAVAVIDGRSRSKDLLLRWLPSWRLAAAGERSKRGVKPLLQPRHRWACPG